jgi:hypothetical protein
MRPFYLLFSALTLLAAPYAQAQNAAIDIIPAASHEEGGADMENLPETHPALKLSPDKSEIITLPEDIGTVVVGNPAHFSIFADSPRRLIAVPKAPGASYFTVLNKAGAVIMQRHVLVAPPKEKYVRIRKTCYGESAKDGCLPTQTYYCPDMCHEISSGGAEPGKTGNSADSDAAKAAGQPGGEPSQTDETTDDTTGENTAPQEDPVQE